MMNDKFRGTAQFIILHSAFIIQRG